MTSPSWPWPGDNATDRARRVANSLLALLPHDVQSRAVVSARAVGETWLGQRLVTYTPDQAITTAQAAAMLGISPDVVRQWACRHHPTDPNRPLLRREGMRGREQTYLVRNVLEASFQARRRRVLDRN